MFEKPSGSRWRSGAAALALATTTAFGFVGCGSSDDSTSTAGTSAASTTADASAVKASKCGLGNGKKATGAPIKLGALVNNAPGLDFSGVGKLAAAYFKCVNDNGGINGRPVDYTYLEDQLDPQQTAQRGSLLTDQKKVDGIVAAADLLDCTVNQKKYEQAGYNVIAVGIVQACFEAPNFAPVQSSSNTIPLVAKQFVDNGAKTLVMANPDSGGGDVLANLVKDYATQRDVTGKAVIEKVPITDPTSVALQLAQEAGDGGGVILNIPAPEALKILQAAQQQGLTDTVKWGCGPSCVDDTLAKTLGSAWDGKFTTGGELAVADSDDPDNQLYRAVTEKYAPDVPLGSYGQVGFLSALIATKILMDVPEADLTKEGINKAFKNAKNISSTMMCKPWYFGDQNVHYANNVIRTLTLKDGKFVESSDCEPVPALPGNHLDEIRAYEKQNGLDQ